MKRQSFLVISIFCLCLMGLLGCENIDMRRMIGRNDPSFQFANSFREPSLGSRWLVTLANTQGKERIEMVDLSTRRRIALPGINRADSRPISVSVSANGNRVAFIQLRGDQTELFLYRRSLGTLQRLDINPKGIPRRVSLDGAGRILAVQVSRDGRWDVDLIRLPG